MIAPWLYEILSRERDWRGALRRVANDLASLRRERAHLDLARALEHLEPDLRFVIAAYQHVGAERDGGRALALALELGSWADVVPLATQQRTMMGSLEAMIWEARGLLELHALDKVERLLPAAPSEPRLAALRAELTGGSEDALATWLAHARAQTGPGAAESYYVAGRLARALRKGSWESWMEKALAEDPRHVGAALVLTDPVQGSSVRDPRRLLETLRKRLVLLEERGDLVGRCEVARHAAMRWWFSEQAPRHRGLARRLLLAELERAYLAQVSPIPGHLAMWAVLDEAAEADRTRADLLPVLIGALEAPMPVHDRVWLAALGAEICASVGNLSAAYAYAAIVADHAPLHPVVRECFAGAAVSPGRAESDLRLFRNALRSLEVEACEELQIEQIAPLDEELGLAPSGPGETLTPEEEALELALNRSAEDEQPLGSAGAGPAATVAAEAVEVEVARTRPLPALGELALPSGRARPRRPVAWASATPRGQERLTRPRVKQGPPLGDEFQHARAALAGGSVPAPLERPPAPLDAVPRAARVAVPMDLRLFVHDRELTMQSRDVSTTGMFAVTFAELPIGAVLRGELRVPRPGLRECLHVVQLRVVRRDDIGYGLEFVEPSPALKDDLRRLEAAAT